MQRGWVITLPASWNRAMARSRESVGGSLTPQPSNIPPNSMTSQQSPSIGVSDRYINQRFDRFVLLCVPTLVSSSVELARQID
jgi:hypothetical protein